MKKFIAILAVLSGLSSSADAFAEQIHKCVDAQGQASFSYSSCRLDNVNESNLIDSKMAELDLLDAKISHLNRKIRDSRLFFEASPGADRGAFELKSTQLKSELSVLVSKRSKIVEGTVSLLTMH